MNDFALRGLTALDKDTLLALEDQVNAWENGEVARFVAKAP